MRINTLGSTDKIQILVERLKHIPLVVATATRRGSESSDAEAWQIATALSDIEESMNKLFSELVPKLLNSAPEGEAAADLLIDIGEEYRHILYHILDTRLFGYVVPQK